MNKETLERKLKEATDRIHLLEGAGCNLVAEVEETLDGILHALEMLHPAVTQDKDRGSVGRAIAAWKEVLNR